MSPAGSDPFGTEQLRRAALSTWRTDPSRLRQDANLEEDHARGYYRDRVVVELAQNAADAAAAAGAPGRLLLQLRTGGTELLAANTGAPLTAAGVAALASMRASTKTDAPTVGRFGVGFAAVRSVSDEITVATRLGGGDDVAGVVFSLERTGAALAEAAHDSEALAAVVHRREGELPALRLPFPAPGAAVPAGYATAVRLALRGPAELQAVRAALAQVDDALLLALPALGEVVVDVGDGPRVLVDVGRRWWTAHDAGLLDPELLADRPVEERGRARWAVTWAVPRSGGGAPAARTVHAPTPTEEPTTVPALLIATFPLDPTRRHVAAGRLTDTLVGHAARVYAELAEQVAADGGDALALVPTALPAGRLDAVLHDAVVPALRHAAVLREVGTGELVSARRAQAMSGPLGQDRAVLEALAALVPGLVALPTERSAQARLLEVEVRDPGDVVDTLPTTTGRPEEWWALYEALAPHAAVHREALAGVPVPLADGRVVRGARGVLVPTAAVPDVPGVRLVHPGAAHPVLLTLGARQAGAVELLDEPGLRETARTGGEHTGTVLALAGAAVAEHGSGVRLPAWLAELRLPTAEGDEAPAAELVLPGTWAAQVFDGLAELEPGLAGRWPQSTWSAVGVRTALTVSTVHDVVAEPADPGDAPVEGWADYLDHLAQELGAGAYVEEVAVVADLDAVADDAWGEVLRAVAADPAARAALLAPVRPTSGGRPDAGVALSYTAWWLRDELGAPFAMPGEVGAAGLPFLPEAPEAVRGLDPEVLAALGAVRDLEELDAAGWERYLEAWPDAGELSLPQALVLWQALARAARDGVLLPAPDVLPVLAGTEARMLAADDVVVAPLMWAQVRPVLPTPAPDVALVAEALDLAAAADVEPEAHGAQRVRVPAAVAVLLPGAPPEWWECESLTVEGVEVDWWVSDGEVYATTGAGLARGLTHAAGRWPSRFAVEAVLADPDRLDEAMAEAAGE